jgi:uncharacterized protein YjbJ (UPF0337 family)
MDELFLARPGWKREIHMNKDQINGALKNALGKVQEHAGKTIGSAAQRTKGLVRQGEGRLQKAYGNVKDALKNSRHS